MFLLRWSSFFDIYEVDVNRGILFDGLLDDHLKCGYLICAGMVFSKTCLLVS